MEQTFMKIAEAVAKESPDQHMKVGCVGVQSLTNNIIACGYNSMPGKEDHEIWNDRDARRPLVVHAEVMLCSYSIRNQFDTVYITLFPCVNCMLTLIQHGVKRVVYKDIYDKDLEALKVADFYGIKHHKLI